MSLGMSGTGGGESTALIPKFPDDKRRFPLYRQGMLFYLASVGLVKYLNDTVTNQLVKSEPIVKLESQSAATSSSTPKDVEIIDKDEVFTKQCRVCAILYSS